MFFFFSSRRRHTRLQGDWSSDVCSSDLTFKAGLIHTPWLDWEEAVWDYRMQGTMATDRAGYLSAADYGEGVDGKRMADKVNFQFTVLNGTFYLGTSAGARKGRQAPVSGPG